MKKCNVCDVLEYMDDNNMRYHKDIEKKEHLEKMVSKLLKADVIEHIRLGHKVYGIDVTISTRGKYWSCGLEVADEDGCTHAQGYTKWEKVLSFDFCYFGVYCDKQVRKKIKKIKETLARKNKEILLLEKEMEYFSCLLPKLEKNIESRSKKGKKK